MSIQMHVISGFVAAHRRPVKSPHPTASNRITTLSVAVNNPRKRDAEPVWYRVTMWNGLGTAVAQYVDKGDYVVVHGERLAVSTWLDQEGNARATLELTPAASISAPTGRGNGESASSDANPTTSPFRLVLSSKNSGHTPAVLLFFFFHHLEGLAGRSVLFMNCAFARLPLLPYDDISHETFRRSSMQSTATDGVRVRQLRCRHAEYLYPSSNTYGIPIYPMCAQRPSRWLHLTASACAATGVWPMAPSIFSRRLPL